MSARDPLFAFFGTPRFSVHVLDALEAHGLLPALVVTAEDKRSGRGLASTPSPAKVWATERGIDVATPASLKDPSFVAEMKNTDWDCFVVAAYAKLLPKEILALPHKGCLNVHPSLLPKFRGPSPALSAILADERTTGVSIMLLEEKMDAGPVLAQAQVELEEEAWPPRGSDFEELLATEGGTLLSETLPLWLENKITPEVQEEKDATYTKKFSDADARLDLAGNVRENFLKIRAFTTSPRAYFINEKGKRVIIADAQYQNGTLSITRVIPEGKKEMAYANYLRGQNSSS